MNKVLYYLITLYTVVSLLTSCAENREDEYRPRTDTNKWIVDKMNDVYLWNSTMRTSDKTNAVPEIFFPTVLTSNGNGGRSDNYSFIDVNGNTERLVKENNSYGFEYFIETVEGKAISARVLMVYKNSPAHISGLKRGDRITAVNGIKLTKENISVIEKGGGGDFQISVYHKDNSKPDENGNQQYIWEVTDTINMAASSAIEYYPIYLDSIYNIEGKSIGYIVLNNSAAKENMTDWTDNLAQTIGRMKNCDEIIADIRYNSESNIAFVTELASMLYGQSSAQDIFLTKKHNSNHTDKDSIIYFTDKYSGNRLNISRLNFIISDKTAMEAEAMLRRLSELMEIRITGTNSAGKNAILEPFTNPQYTQYVIYPVVAFYSAENENTNNFSPINVDISANEQDKAIERYMALGDTAEIMLKSCINSILHPESTDNPDSENQ